VSVTVAGLFVYPIKSLRGIPLESARVEKRGLRYDRRWMLVDENGLFYTQRRVPELALFDVALGEDCLRIHRRGKELCVPLRMQRERLPVRVWRSNVTAVAVSQEADAWFTDTLGRPARLVYAPAAGRRRAKGPAAREGDLIGFADSNPILVAGQASLDDLNSRLGHPLPMRRFRPNIVLTGSRAFEEDDWREIRVGDHVRLRWTRHCGRCVVTTIDPETALSGPEPLRTLATYRLKGKAACFGSHYAPDALGEIRVGDEVEVI
jgi:uncharacterized protein